MNKNKYFFVGVVLSLMLFSCDDTTFSISDDIDSQIDKVDFCPPDIGVSVPSLLKQNVEEMMSNVVSAIGPSVENEAKKKNVWPVDSIYLKSLKMSMKSSPESPTNSNTLGFLVSVEIYISADGEQEQLWAVADNIEEKSTEIVFEPKKVNMKPYIDKGIKTSTKITVRYCPNVDIPIKISYKAEIGF